MHADIRGFRHQDDLSKRFLIKELLTSIDDIVHLLIAHLEVELLVDFRDDRIKALHHFEFLIRSVCNNHRAAFTSLCDCKVVFGCPLMQILEVMFLVVVDSRNSISVYYVG